MYIQGECMPKWNQIGNHGTVHLRISQFNLTDVGCIIEFVFA